MEWLNFRHLHAFWAVCRSGSFSKAAERIYISQSTVSEHVAALEEYFDEPLIERNTRSLSVTKRGEALMAYADEIFGLSADINHVFRDKRASTLARHLRVGMVGGISRNYVFGKIIDALGKSEALRIDVLDGSFDELSRLMRGFELDLILGLDRPRQKDLFTMQYSQVMSSPVRLVGTAPLVERVLEAREESLAVELYSLRHPFEGSPLSERCAEHYKLETILPVWTDDISLLRFLANSGRGLALVPEIGVWEDLKAERVIGLTVPGAPSIDIHAVYPKKGAHMGLIEAFLDMELDDAP